MTVNQYIGARYVPLFADPAEWNDTRSYEPLTIVLHEGNSFTSKQFVPVGIDIDNADYWAETGDYNAQVEQYRKEVLGFDARITQNANDIAETSNTLTANIANIIKNEAFISLYELGGKPNDPSFNNATLINESIENNPGRGIYVPQGDWYIENTIVSVNTPIICTGQLKLSINNLTDNTMVKLGAVPPSPISSKTMIRNATFIVNVDGSDTYCNGVTIGGFFRGNISLFIAGCLNTAFDSFARCIECNLDLTAYGKSDTEFGNIGINISANLNDIHINAKVRNFTDGIKLDNCTYIMFGDTHVWGCKNGINDCTSGIIFINSYYCDYNNYGIHSTTSNTDTFGHKFTIEALYMLVSYFNGGYGVFWKSDFLYRTGFVINSFDFQRTKEYGYDKSYTTCLFPAGLTNDNLLSIRNHFHCDFYRGAGVIGISESLIMSHTIAELKEMLPLFKFSEAIPGLSYYIPSVSTENQTEFKEKLIALGAPVVNNVTLNYGVVPISMIYYYDSAIGHRMLCKISTPGNIQAILRAPDNSYIWSLTHTTFEES